MDILGHRAAILRFGRSTYTLRTNGSCECFRLTSVVNIQSHPSRTRIYALKTYKYSFIYHIYVLQSAATRVGCTQ